MISSDNLALNNFTNDEDFTYSNYRGLLKMAKSGWKILDYRNIDWDEKFIVWRHDVDYSLNCSLKLAKVEQQEGVKSTYFINPHSEFYNIAELSQHRIVKQILSFGHDLGLHFDAAFYEINSEAELDVLVAKESTYLEDLFGVKPTAFSFHNPVSKQLECEADEYGGLKNCYSTRFKEAVGYCSDSNGYWRFRRLYEVLKQERAALQVLTHPGWWQKNPYPPRQRIFRAIFGRARQIMKLYDRQLENHQRVNFAGLSEILSIFHDKRPDEFELCDYLWNKGNFKTLFLKIWMLHEGQIKTLCEQYFEKVWRVSKHQIKQLCYNNKVRLDGHILFNALFQNEWENILGSLAVDYKMWKKNRNLLVVEKCLLSKCELEKGCLYLCSVINKFADWGLRQKFKSDGLDVHKTEKLETMKFSESNVQFSSEYKDDWLSFKERLESIPN